MDNLRSVLSIVLSKIPPAKILSGDICYNNITKDKFVQIAGYYVKNYSNDELENLFLYICSEYEEQADYVRGYARQRNFIENEEKKFNIFNAVLIFAVRTLQELDGEPVCQYENMLRWRMTSHELDEDVFTTAFLAFKDVRYLNLNRSFSWRPVIRHNNVYLNKILAQGMADNHFHLKGSAPQFPLSWISMMNNVTSTKFRKLIEDYADKRLSAIFSMGTEEHLYISYLKAALIRCYLFAELTDNMLILRDADTMEKEENAVEKLSKTERKRDCDRILYNLLCDENEILFYRKQIQDNINYFKSLKIYDKKFAIDYALNGQYYHGDMENDVNFILSGERWLMYTLFQLIFSKNEKYKNCYNMFYAYLVIKGTIRSELVQTNANMGFDNFARYQDRKEDFIDDTPFEKYYVEMAVKGTLKNQNILHLETRITPKTPCENNKNYIEKFDKILKNDPELMSKYYYVFHFIKEKDNEKALESNELCRHYFKREKLRYQAVAIALFRKRYPVTANRLKGIDACAKEIGCRPEVFAQTYRYLRNHIVYRSEESQSWMKQIGKDIQSFQLSMTYHIGEDYLDVIDGLRSIDEAVRYLQLDCGSRIGHALALGVDVEEYYKIKKNRILISQQDYLDNLVWLYYKIKQFGLSQCDDLLLYIEQEYSKYFRLIYGNHIDDVIFHAVIEDAKAFHRQDGKSFVEGYSNSQFYFRLPEYYDAWKLRGDDPTCYICGYYKEPEDISEWSYYAVNRSGFVDHKTRYNPECAYLYYLYHYCGEAKKEGSKVIEIRITHQVIECVKVIQEGMRKWIGKLGIGIETNPSSNYLIGPFKRYDKHPIIGFYNVGLTASPEELDKCPQLAVCVNTDDQGIFSTYLENEYALLALALEKAKDENGNAKYNRSMIYQWIDNIRKLGLHLSFARNED